MCAAASGTPGVPSKNVVLFARTAYLDAVVAGVGQAAWLTAIAVSIDVLPHSRVMGARVADVAAVVELGVDGTAPSDAPARTGSPGSSRSVTPTTTLGASAAMGSSACATGTGDATVPAATKAAMATAISG